MVGTWAGRMATGFGMASAVLAAPFAVAFATDVATSAYGQMWVETLVEVASDPTLVSAYDADPGGIFVYRFGLSGDYAIRCKEGAVVGVVLPRGVSDEDVPLARVCARIHTNLSQEGASGLL